MGYWRIFGIAWGAIGLVILNMWGWRAWIAFTALCVIVNADRLEGLFDDLDDWLDRRGL